ncbi:tannase/feruloyl esterase family alpha/beta hydrolase [Sorangium sp. So ce296]|uniref:tannase/feruloyl esterase family alpha/beta hydrolase n=1 Tax=Sorangium sp. So ce296 TaxID=3133296 RepID=UPI003F60249C
MGSEATLIPFASKNGLWTATASALAFGCLAACSGDDGGPAPDTAPPLAVRCAQLANMQIPSDSIGLPTTGAVVTSTQMNAAQGAVGEHCLVSGDIMPVDPTAPNIKFQVALPAGWNSKAVMLGGGGFCGIIPDVAGNPLNTTPDAVTPLGRGYAVFASDAGHQSNPLDGSFALNQEAYANWVSDALKKTRDAAIAVVEATYGEAPTKAYFLGSSTGGRQALAVAGRWPEDWDGCVALYPARNVTTAMVGALAMIQAFAAPGAYLDPEERGVLYRAAVAACDALDGASDGVISDVQGCNATFDPSTASLDGVPVRCPDGVDTGDTCLSDAQLTALGKANGEVPFDIPLASGEASFPGFNAFISDLGMASSSPLQPHVAAIGLGSAPPGFPVTESMSYGAHFADGFIRYAVARDAAFDYLTFDVSNAGAFASRVTELSALDVAYADLTAFAAKGGKLLMLQGTEDLLVSPRAVEAYYSRLRADMGADEVDSFLRYYEVPGFGHSVSAAFTAGWDYLTALERWVEAGADPATDQIVVDTTGVPGRTRPLCVYPTWPQYKGSGDMDSAASFACTAN